MIAFLYILFLAVIFIGMSKIILKMALGDPQDASMNYPRQENISMVIPAMLLGLIVLFLGIYMPASVDEALQKASGLLGGS